MSTSAGRPLQHDSLSPSALASAFRRGNHDAFVAVVSQCEAKLRAYAWRYARDATDVDDVLQSVWALAWEKHDQWRGDNDPLGWLLHLTRTICLRTARVNRRYVAIPDVRDLLAPVEDGLETEPTSAWIDLADTMADLVMALPPRQRTAVILRFFGGQSTRQIARRMKIAEGTVKATVHQGIQGIRTHASAGQLATLERHFVVVTNDWTAGPVHTPRGRTPRAFRYTSR